MFLKTKNERKINKKDEMKNGEKKCNFGTNVFPGM